MNTLRFIGGEVGGMCALGFVSAYKRLTPSVILEQVLV